MTWAEMTTEQRVEAIRPLWMRGDSSGMIAREFGVTRSVIIGYVHRNLKGVRQSPAPANSLRRKRSPSPPSAPSIHAMKPRPVGRPRIIPPPRQAPVLPPNLVLPETGTVEITARRLDQCAFPMWPASQSVGLFCGRPVEGAPPYCAAHNRLCRMKPERTSLGRHVAAIGAEAAE